MHITTFAHGNEYFGAQPTLISNPDIDTLAYLSFEDALWDFLKHKLHYGDTLLFPEFFCMDVLDNCIAHGYKVELYPTEDNLSHRMDLLVERIHRYSPQLVVLFHPLGIPNKLLNHPVFHTYSGWILEDSVHRIVDPNMIKFYSDKHIIIDSVRKLTPLPGSTIYASHKVLDYTPQKQNANTERDKTKALEFWNSFQALLGSDEFEKVLYAYQLLNSGDNLIGDSINSITLPKELSEQKNHLDIQKIYNTKQEQYKVYESILKNILLDDRFIIPFFREKLKPEQLAFYPLIMKSDYAFLLKEFLLLQEIQTFVEFSDSPWAVNKNVICLPLGPHITLAQVRVVCQVILKWFQDRALLVS